MIDLHTLKRLFPFEAHYFDTGGPRMHYLDEGVGEPVVMLHGNPTWSFFFRHLVSGVKDQARVIVPDHIGCGLSEKPQNYPYTLQMHIDNLKKLLDHLEVDRVTLVLHDWGTAIGMGWAVHHVDRVKRLVVLNGAAFLGLDAPARIRFCIAPGIGEFLLRTMNAFAWAATHMAVVKHDRMTEEVKGAYLLPYGNYENRVAILGFVRDIPRDESIPSHAVLKEIDKKLSALRDKPILICWGMRDFCFTRSFLQEWWERFPRAEVHCFEDAGHYVLEDAHEKITPLVREFLTNK